tara:strand:- start:1832 stop:2896 length:1065 start_codon:yes stop_codon:yes gene_type:complete
LSERTPFKRRSRKGASATRSTTDYNRSKIEDLELRLRSKTSELGRALTEIDEIEANNKILNRQYEEASRELGYLKRKNRKDIREFERYRSEAEKRERARNDTLIRRIVGGPFRFINSILSREVRVRDEKITNQRKALTALENKQAELKRELAEQKKESEKFRWDAETWKKRHNVLKKDVRKERGLEKDPLIISLRDDVARKQSEIEILEERLSLASSESHRPARTVESVNQALTMAEDDFENIVILESAWKSAKKSNYRNPELVYKTLGVISTEAESWQSEPDGDGSFESRLRLHLDVADHDSKDRYWNTGEISERMNKHVKMGVDHNPRNTLRIYYDIKRKGSVRIAYCGEHP